MAGLKITMEFVQDKYSWTESHWYLTTSLNPPLQLGVPQAQALAAVRVPLLGNGCALQRVRISQFPANRQVLDVLSPYIATVPTWPPDPSPNGTTYTASRAFTALLAILEDVNGDFRNYYVGGVPGALAHAAPGAIGDQSGITWAAVPDFSARAAAYNQFLTNQNWGWMTRRNTTFSQAQGPPVSNAAFPGMIGIQTAAQLVGLGLGLQGGPAQIGTLVQLKGWRRLNTRLQRLGGVWQVGGILAPVAPSTLWTYFLFNSSGVPLTNYKANGQIGVLYQSFLIYNSLSWDEITQRKRGATVNRPRGRSRSRF